MIVAQLDIVAALVVMKLELLQHFGNRCSVML
jgi:hypothetical protein